MEKYNYLEAVKNDVLCWIDENLSLAEWDDEELLLDHLDSILFTADSVTGNASGSYTCNAYTAEEYIAHNWDIIGEMIDEGYIIIEQFRRGPETIDVIIRCYVLRTAIEEALTELREDKNNNYDPIVRESSPLAGSEIAEFYSNNLRIEFSLDQINKCFEEWNRVFVFIAELFDELDCSFIGEPYSMGNFSMAHTIYNAHSGAFYTLIYSEINDTLLKNKPLYLTARDATDDDLIALIENNGIANWTINNNTDRITIQMSDELITYWVYGTITHKHEIPRDDMNIIETRDKILEQLGFDLQRITLHLVSYACG